MHRKQTCGISGTELRKRVAFCQGWYNVSVSDWEEEQELDWGGVHERHRDRVCRLPHWHESISDAMSLVDEMNADKRFCGVNLGFDTNANRWEADLSMAKGFCDGEFEVGNDLPTAICRLYIAYKIRTAGDTVVACMWDK
jgi:hypothetical protein